jgi:hypothetical protein
MSVMCSRNIEREFLVQLYRNQANFRTFSSEVASVTKSKVHIIRVAWPLLSLLTVDGDVTLSAKIFQSWP